MEDMDRAVPVNEETLFKMARGLSSTLRCLESETVADEEFEQVERILGLAIKTASTANLSPNHRTAACNLLCGTVEKCLSSSDGNLVSRISIDALFEVMHRLYFMHYHGAKEKSMKQIFGVLVKLLARARIFSESSRLLDQSLKYTFEILFRDNDRAKAKPAFFALHQYLLKSLVLPSELLFQFYNWNGRFRPDAFELSTSLVAQHFLRGILEWVIFGDVAASAAQLATNFLRAISNPYSGIRSTDTEAPIWAEPLTQCVALHPSYIQPFRTYVLPSLFKHDFEKLWLFLQSLRVTQHLGLERSLELSHRERTSTFDLKTERLMLFLTLQAGIEQGIVTMSGDSELIKGIQVTKGSIIITNTVLYRLLEQSSHEARLAGLTLLVTSPETTKPYSRSMLRALGSSLPYFFEDVDSSFRGEVQSLLQVFFNRLRAISVAAARASLSQKLIKSRKGDLAYPSDLLEVHKSFISKLLRFLTFELHPASSYQRRISSLKTLITLLKSGLDDNVPDADLSKQAKFEPEWPFHLNCVTLVLRRVLTDALMDPFEDIRQSSLECLKLVRVDVNQHPDDERFDPTKVSTLTKAQHQMNRSGRLDHAEGFARLCLLTFYYGYWKFSSHERVHSALIFLEDVLSNMEESVNVASKDLPTAVDRYPVHGHLLALRFLMDQSSEVWYSAEHGLWKAKNLLYRQLHCLETIWQSVNHVLCNDAPEGFTPHDLSGSPDFTTKDLLSYAWRSLKESSLLLRTLATRNLHLFSDDTATKCSYLQTLGNLSFTQLAELRHRGAFSTVAQSFAAVCRECSSTHDAETQSLVNQWYRRSLLLIDSKSTVITRRSAGIPALLVGILASEPKNPSKDELIGKLCTIAIRPSPELPAQNLELPQVHALNSLAAIFSNSAVGEHCNKHIVKVMEVASRCLGSRIWAIRNCGLILFRGLADRLLGSNESLDGSSGSESSRASRLSYETYPGLIELVQSLLTSTVRNMETSSVGSTEQEGCTMPLETVFAVVGLLRRAPPPSSHLTSIRRLIFLVNNSPYWHVRDLAARAFAASIKRDETSGIIRDILPIQSSEQNQLHGRILCIKYMVYSMAQGASTRFPGASKNFFLEIEELDTVYLILSNCKTLLLAGNSPTVTSECLRLINTLGHLILQACSLHLGSSDFHNIVELFRILTTELQLPIVREPTAGRETQISKCLYVLIAAEAGKFGAAQLSETARKFSWLLSFDDSVSCQYVLASLTSVLHNTQSTTRRIFADGLASSLRSNKNINVVRGLEAVLLEVCNSLSQSELLSAKAVSWYCLDLQVGTRLRSPLSPGEAYHDITMWGFSLFQKWQHENHASQTIIKEAESWIGLMQLSLESDDNFSLRYAAVKSMRWFARVFPVSQDLPGKLRMLAALALHDALNDDDGDLRALAAEASSFLLEESLGPQNLSESVVPLAAAKLIVSNIIQHCHEQPWIIGYAINRLLQHNPKTACRPLSVHARFEEMEREETVLFVVEKQNLYVDEVREVRVWSRLLQSCSLKDTSHQDLNRLTEWTMSGLDTLIAFALQQNDGPLGYISKPGAFAMGMRVIRAAESLLVWRTRSARVPVQASTILTKLHKLYCMGQVSGSHELWLVAIAEILRKSITMRLKRLVLAMKKVPVEIS